MKPAIATPDDFENWLSLAAEVEYLFGPMVDEPQFRDSLRGMLSDGRARCLREGDGAPGTALIGGIIVSLRHNSIAWFAVAERSRGCGAGRMLLEAALALLRDDQPVVVQTFDETCSHGTPARRLYASCGFRDARPGDDTPAGVPTVFMERPAGWAL